MLSLRIDIKNTSSLCRLHKRNVRGNIRAKEWYEKEEPVEEENPEENS